GNLDDRIAIPMRDAARVAFRVAPVRPLRIRPPLEMVVERDCMSGWGEHDGAGDEVLRWRAGKIFRARRALRDRHILCSLDELRKLLVGDFRGVHPEAV